MVNKPATPLPWKAVPAVGDEVATYIVHAANAYPKLVHALRLENVNEHGEQRQNTPIAVLLRELGELE